MERYLEFTIHWFNPFSFKELKAFLRCVILGMWDSRLHRHNVFIDLKQLHRTPREVRIVKDCGGLFLLRLQYMILYLFQPRGKGG